MWRSISVSSLCYCYATISRYIALLYGEFIYGGHLAALGSAIMVFTISILLNIKINLPLLASAYLSTLIVYSYDYHKDAKKDTASNYVRASHLARRVKFYPYMLTFYMVSFIFLLVYLGNLSLLALSAGLALSGILYSVLFKGFTRQIPGFKNMYTSAIWAVGSTFYLAAYYSLRPGIFFFLMFLFIFLKVLVNTIFYDVKDIEADRYNGLKTLPVSLGESKTMMLLHLLNVAAGIPILTGVCIGVMPPYALSLSASCISMASYLIVDKDMGYTRYILADIETLLWPILLLVGKAAYNAL